MSDGEWMGADEGEAAYMEAQAEQAYAEEQAQQALEAEAAYAEYMASQPARSPDRREVDFYGDRGDFLVYRHEWDALHERVRRLTEGLRKRDELIRKTIYVPEGYTGPDAWWADEARALLADSPPESGEDYDYKNDSAEGRWGVKSSHPDGGGARRLVSVNHADAATDIVGKSAICPDCGNALLVDGGGAK